MKAFESHFVCPKNQAKYASFQRINILNLMLYHELIVFLIISITMS